MKSEIATFLEAFPNGAVFANTVNGQGYDLVLYGPVGDRRIDVDAVQAAAQLARGRADPPLARAGGINSAVELFGTYAGSRGDMTNWLKDGAINTDRNLRLQYLAGAGTQPLSERADLPRDDPEEQISRRGSSPGSPETLIDAAQPHRDDD